MADLTGIWSCDDGGFYYIRQIDNTITWVGMSNDRQPKGPIKIGLYGGLDFCNVFSGTISGSSIQGSWADVPRGMKNNTGVLNLVVVERLSSPELNVQNETGGFGGTAWRRFFGVLPLWEPIQDAFKEIHKNVPSSWFELITSKETLHDNLDVIEDSVTIYGALDACPPLAQIGFPSDLEPSWRNFMAYPNAQDGDVAFNINVDLTRLPTALKEKMSQNNWRLLLKETGNPRKKEIAVVHCEMVMFAQNNEHTPILRPAWASLNSESVLINGRPINAVICYSGDLYSQLDTIFQHDPGEVNVLSLGHRMLRPGAIVRVIGAMVWDVGHCSNNKPGGYPDNLELHPVYSLDIVAPLGVEDLSGVWGTSDGGTSYLRQIGNSVWMFWMPAHGDQSYGTVFQGTLTGRMIVGSWFDVPFGDRRGYGTLTLEVLPGYIQLFLMAGTGTPIGGQVLWKLYETDVVSSLVSIAPSEATGRTKIENQVRDLRRAYKGTAVESPSGAVYLRLLNQHAPELAQLMRADSHLRARIYEVFQAVIAMSRRRISTRRRISPDLLKSIDSLFSDPVSGASPELQRTLQQVRGELRHFKGRTFLQGLKAADIYHSSQTRRGRNARSVRQRKHGIHASRAGWIVLRLLQENLFEIVNLIRRNEDIREMAALVFSEFAKSMPAWKRDETTVVRPSLIKSLDAFSNMLAREGSLELKNGADLVRHVISHFRGKSVKGGLAAMGIQKARFAVDKRKLNAIRKKEKTAQKKNPRTKSSHKKQTKSSLVPYMTRKVRGIRREVKIMMNKLKT